MRALDDTRLSEAIRARGGRVTPQRRLILEHVQRQDGHFTADQLLASAVRDRPGLSAPTVYATLDLLEELGLVHRVPGLGGTEVYDPRTDSHDHLVCRVCRRVADVDLAVDHAAVMRRAEASGFTPESASLAVIGVCSACAAAAG
jgi:Fur family transcriptional regulator, stress-responsive regulator